VHELDRIEQALASKPLNHNLFERCAQDLLIEVYPGLTPIPGGTDWGRDADVHTGKGLPPRLLVTSSRTLEGVRQNMNKGIASMIQHGVPFDRIVLANCAQLSQIERDRLGTSARKRGATIEAIYGRGFFASRLRRDGEWRSKLLGLSADPITLSRTPDDLAESPWRELPLVGREREVVELSSATGDLVVSGPPGVGKTRALAGVAGAYFVDHDAARGRLADDLRWLKPEIVVVDDAGAAEQLVKRLVRLRIVEADIANYQIVAVCWPDEVDSVSQWLGSDHKVELDLLERSEMDQLLLSMGITGQLARAEILDQSEGRPGWAISMGDMLLRASDTTSLRNGQALSGQVKGYFLRAALPNEATDLLAIVAAVGAVTEEELGDVASELNMSRPQVVRLLAGAAKSGLIDVQSRYDFAQQRHIRHYAVRPPMLADALVAERAFKADVPGIDLRRLADRWPDKLRAIAESAIDSALLGASAARTEAEHFYRLSMGLSDVPGALLSERFARIDRQAANVVLGNVRAAFTAWHADPEAEPWHIEPAVELAYLLARWYLVDDAVELLLDAALADPRPTNAHPEHPLRKLTDLVHSFHPELPAPSDQRQLLLRVAERWIERESTDDRWAVYGHAADDVLSVQLGGTVPAPGNPASFQIIQTITGADEMRRVYEEIWPLIKRRLEIAPPGVVKTVIEAVEDWLRVGKGFDRPFGQSQPQASIEAAKEFGEKMLAELVPFTVNHHGLAAHLKEVAEQFEVKLDLQADDTYSILFVDVDLVNNWQAATSQLEARIAEVVESWADEDPMVVIQRLLSLRAELELANVRWPDRVWMACNAVADRIAAPLAWAEMALDQGLFPEASPFVERAVAGAMEFGQERLARFTSVPAARWTVMSAILKSTNSEPDYGQLLPLITPADYRMLQTLFLRAEVTPARTRDLLTKPSPTTRAAVATAMFTKAHLEQAWSPGEFESEWLEAIEQLDPEGTPGFADYDAGRLAQFLATHYPASLVRWTQSRLEHGVSSGYLYRALPHSAWENMYHLPHESKDELWRQFGSDVYLIGEYLVGADIDWLEHALDEGLLTADEALSTHNALGPHPTIEQFARLLVPRGVDPRRVAWLAQGGTWTGDESARYGELIEQFEALAASNEEAVAAVGRAGIEMFTAKRDVALAAERLSRIRGEL
jgi:hypothetical protein